VLFGLVDLAIFLYPLAYVAAWPAAVGMVLVGLPGAVTTAGFMTLFQRHTTDSHRGRVYGLLALVQSLAVVVGTTTAGLLGGLLGIVPVLAYQGAGYVAAGGLVLAMAVSTRAATAADKRPLESKPMRDEHPSITAFRAALLDKGGTGRVVVLPDSVHTAALAAEALGCQVGAIANSLVFDADGGPVLILTSGAHRVDTGKVAAELGVAKLGRATPDFVKQHTGQVIGGVSPIAHPAPVPTYVDPTLRQYDEIWAAAGHPAAVFSTTYDELLTLTGATEIDVN